MVSPGQVLARIRPGMSIFVGTGVAEPRTLIKHLMSSDLANLKDLEIIQLLSLGDVIPPDERYAAKYRLKTFFSMTKGYDAMMAGRIDWIPCVLSQIPHLFQTDAVKVDAAFVQITPPDKRGLCSLGVSVDVAKHAIERAGLVVGEINEHIPYTFGDTFIHIDDFHYIIRSAEPLFYTLRWDVDPVFDRIAEIAASVIEDGSCLSFFLGPLYEALVKHLSAKKDLGIHTLVFSDPLMELVKSGAVSNKNKRMFTGKSVAAYAQGTPELMDWLDGNQLVEFQRLDIVLNPKNMSRNDRVVVVMPAYKVDISGAIALHAGRGKVVTGPSDFFEFLTGAALSAGGCNIFALPSRNLKGDSNILPSVENYPNQFSSELIDVIVTEFGAARLGGRSLRERAMALIDIAHPDHRDSLVRDAKGLKLIYRNQIYNSRIVLSYPENISATRIFKNNVKISFRPIRPSDEDGMRRLFYRFSDQGIFYRYFSNVQEMPHERMQDYVNVDYAKTMSIVGTVAEGGIERIVAEGRYTRTGYTPFADVSFIVDEKHQGSGIATFMIGMLENIAKTRGIRGFNAYILPTNSAMIKMMEKSAPHNSLVIDEGLQMYSYIFAMEQSLTD